MKRFKPSRSTIWRHAMSANAEAREVMDDYYYDMDESPPPVSFVTPNVEDLSDNDIRDGGIGDLHYSSSQYFESEEQKVGRPKRCVEWITDFDIGERWTVESDTDSEDETYGSQETIREFLASWAVSENIPHSAVGTLLAGLRSHHPTLPRDPRSLLKTSQHHTVRKIAGGEYCHVGLAKGLTKVIENDVMLTKLELQINVDGVPLFKSSSTSLWPILCSVKNSSNRKPFVVGLFCGRQKPVLAKEFLADFVDEAIYLLEHGLTVQYRHIPVVMHSFVCDAPAAAWVKGIKSHSGYSSCGKCRVVGEYYAGKVVLSSTDSPLRTDEEFEAQSDEDHHVQPCPLNPLPVGFVTTFALDAMHVCCLGVARRFILYWKGPVGPLNVRLPRKEVCNLSSKLLFLASYVPLEFARKPRSLDEVHRWKATEFREFLLYSGFLVLDGILPGPLYDHFLLLFVAIRILMSPQLAVTYADYANELLIKFVHDAESLYGKQTLVYNVHSLIHLAADVKKFGSLENFSAFIFENELGHLKKLVRKPQNPIQQILKRLDEKSSSPNRTGRTPVGSSQHRSSSNRSLICSVPPDPLSHTSATSSRSTVILSGTSAGRDETNVSGNIRLILSKIGTLEQCLRYQTQLTQQVLNVLRYDEPADDLPDDIKNKLPISSMSDLCYVEDQIEDKDIQRKLVRHLGSVGGKDVADTTRHVMRDLMTNIVAGRMNFIGRGGKTAIKNMKLLKVIIGAVRQNKSLKGTVTRLEVETVVKLWLRYARDRTGGRQVRLQQQLARRNEANDQSDISD